MKSLFFVCLLTLASLSQAAAQNTSRDLLNLPYGKHPQQTLDLYLPAQFNKRTEVVIMLHGGAWMLGGKYYTEKTSKDLRDRGLIVANVDYRYVSDSIHATQLLSDIKAAIAEMKLLAKKYHFQKKAWHMAGISAGAHLALLFGYTSPLKIKSIAALCPPTRLDSDSMMAFLQKNNLVRNVELLANGRMNPGNSPLEAFTNVSPYAYVKNVPTLLIHGDKDELVPYSQSVFLLEKLQARGIDSKLITMPGKGHDAGMNDPVTEKLALDEITNWIRTHH